MLFRVNTSIINIIRSISRSAIINNLSLTSLSQSERINYLRKMALPKSRENPIILKLDTPDFHSLFTPELNTLASIFQRNNYEIRIAGGAVRDLLMGLKPTDLDFATTATPQEMKDMFVKENVRMINMNGEKHGTITPRINDKENFEVTTLRIDVVTDGRHAEVQFTTDWMLDALRRDLTINSMFLALDGSVYDYFYGYDDLKECKVRFVGDAATRIQEDYLRILRYFRFYGRISQNADSHDCETIKAICDNREGLGRISGERIWVELKKILEGNFAIALLNKIMECRLNEFIGLPIQVNTSEFAAFSARIGNNCSSLKLNAITILASLLNNIEDAVELNARLKLSAFERDLAVFIVENRSPKPHSNPLIPYKQLVLKGKSKDTYKFVIELLKYLNSPYLSEFQEWQIPKFPVTGAMLKANGVEAGKFMGMVMNELKNYWADNDFNLGAEEILKQLPEIVDRLKANRKKK